MSTLPDAAVRARAAGRTAWVFGVAAHGPFYRRLTLGVWGALVAVAFVVLTIGARSPYTHANLGAGYDPGYVRTEQILVGEAADFGGFSPGAKAQAADPVSRGARLYVARGCVTCHALAGRGGPVGPAIAGIDEETITQRVREGPAGMPRFSVLGLSDTEVADISAYLGSVAADK